MQTTLRRLISVPCVAGPSRLPQTYVGTMAMSQQPHLRHLPISATRLRALHSRSSPRNNVSTVTPSQNSSRATNEQIRQAWMEKNRAFQEARSKKNTTFLLYSLGAIAIMAGVTYAAIPLYRAFCSATGFAGTPITDPTRFSPDRLYTTPETEGRKRITVHFQATSSDLLPWKFEPQQRTVKVLPGETALAFYRAKNTSDKDIIGIATYNMTPDKIAPFFAKVECFCFEEQRIRAGEEVDLPVFFFIDRDIMDDPALENVDDIILSYTFFKARRNDQGHAIPDASEEVVLKSQGFDQYEHAPVKMTT